MKRTRVLAITCFLISIGILVATVYGRTGKTDKKPARKVSTKEIMCAF